MNYTPDHLRHIMITMSPARRWGAPRSDDEHNMTGRRLSALEPSGTNWETWSLYLWMTNTEADQFLAIKAAKNGREAFTKLAKEFAIAVGNAHESDRVSFHRVNIKEIMDYLLSTKGDQS